MRAKRTPERTLGPHCSPFTLCTRACTGQESATYATAVNGSSSAIERNLAKDSKPSAHLILQPLYSSAISCQWPDSACRRGQDVPHYHTTFSSPRHTKHPLANLISRCYKATTPTTQSDTTVLLSRRRQLIRRHRPNNSFMQTSFLLYLQWHRLERTLRTKSTEDTRVLTRLRRVGARHAVPIAKRVEFVPRNINAITAAHAKGRNMWISGTVDCTTDTTML